jgi:outer membrane protein FlgP
MRLSVSTLILSALLQACPAAQAEDTLPPITITAERTLLLSGIGFAAISAQPGKTLTERKLMAMRVSHLEAARNLLEQVQGIQFDGASTVARGVMQQDGYSISLRGVVAQARIARITPKGTDHYETVLEMPLPGPQAK